MTLKLLRSNNKKYLHTKEYTYTNTHKQAHGTYAQTNLLNSSEDGWTAELDREHIFVSVNAS